MQVKAGTELGKLAKGYMDKGKPTHSRPCLACFTNLILSL